MERSEWLNALAVGNHVLIGQGYSSYHGDVYDGVVISVTKARVKARRTARGHELEVIEFRKETGAENKANTSSWHDRRWYILEPTTELLQKKTRHELKGQVLSRARRINDLINSTVEEADEETLVKLKLALGTAVTYLKAKT